MARFSIPITDEPGYAEALHEWLRDFLAERDLPTTWRRIRALASEAEGVTVYIAVGSDTMWAEDDPILMILEGSPELSRDRGAAEGHTFYFLFTLYRTAKQKMPYTLRLDERWRVVDFD